MKIATLIGASLESVTAEEQQAQAVEVAEAVAELAAEQADEVSPVVEAVQDANSVGDVIDAVEEIAAAAEVQPEGDESSNGMVSTESLQASLALLLRSHGQQVNIASLESAGGDTREGLALVARKTAAAMRANQQTSFESDMSYLRTSLVERAETIKKAGGILTKIQADLKSNGQLVQGKSLNYEGIYQFLTIDGEQRFDIANVLKEEKVKMEGLIDLLKWFEKAYKEISLDRESDPEKALDILTRCISTLDYTGEMVKLDGLKTLGNGTIRLDESLGHPVIDIEYQIPKGDGSKATIGSRILHSLIPATVGGLLGGMIGRVLGFVGGGLMAGGKGASKGAAIVGGAGAATGIYFGIKKGITKADSKVFGKNTNVELTVDDVTEFVKAAQELIGLVDKIKAQLVVADQGDTQIRNYLKTLHANMKKDDRWKVGAAKVAGFLATALVVGVGQRHGVGYSGPVLGSGLKTHADEIIGNAADLVGAVYAANTSVAEVLVTHVMHCVQGAIGVGAALLGEDPAKAMK